jgi:hypothetical protein
LKQTHDTIQEQPLRGQRHDSTTLTLHQVQKIEITEQLKKGKRMSGMLATSSEELLRQQKETQSDFVSQRNSSQMSFLKQRTTVVSSLALNLSFRSTLEARLSKTKFLLR